MTRPPGDAGRYLHTQPVVVVPARVAWWLTRRLPLADLRARVRGDDTQVDEVLLALAVAGAAWASTPTDPAGSATGTTLDSPPEQAAPSAQALGTTDAAGLLGITDRAVRAACTRGRLSAAQIDGRWQIDRDELETYRANRRRTREDTRW